MSENERHFRRSESISTLAASLAIAQGQIKGATKDVTNTFFSSKYADLASIMDACRKPLSDNGLAILQFPRASPEGVEVETLLVHSSGEWVAETLDLPVKKTDAQGVGSAITYARRYSLAAIVGICPEDDDGNAASASANNDRSSKKKEESKALAENKAKEDQEMKQTLRDKTLPLLQGSARQGVAALAAAWKLLSKETQRACVDDKDALKAIAEEHDREAVSREPGDEPMEYEGARV